MARPRKIDEGVERKILELLEKGLCVSHVAREVGISDVTIKRQRERDLKFNKRFLQASKRGEENIRNLKRLGIRTYRRNVEISPNYYDEPTETPSVAPESRSDDHHKRVLHICYIGCKSCYKGCSRKFIYISKRKFLYFIV